MTGPRSNPARLKWLASILGLVLIYTLPVFTAFGAIDLFLKVGSIEGEVRDKEFAKSIETRSFQHGVSLPVIGNPFEGLPALGPITVTKKLDSSTPPLFTALALGTPNPVELNVVSTDIVRKRFYKIKLYNAVPSGFNMTAVNDGEAPDETVSFNYSRYEMTYTEFQPQSTTPRTDTTAWYDIGLNTSDLTVFDYSNTAPTISSIANTNTAEDTAVTVNFTVGDSQTAAGSLAVSAFSTTTPSLVALHNITFGGSGANRTATITPAANQSGTVTLTFRVSDGTLTAARSFTLTVDAVNDAPTISVIAGKVTEKNTPLSVNFQVNDVDTSVDSLALTAQSSNPALVATGNISFSGTGTSRTATITPATGQIGDASITLFVSDGALSNSSPFVLSVIEPAPLAPSDILLNNNSLPENGTNGMLVGTLSAVDSDSTNHVFTLLDSAGGRFRIQGNQLLVDNGSLLDFETASSHSLLIKATDPDELQFSKNLSIEIQNVNEAPSFLVSDASIIETVTGQDTQVNRLQITDPDAGTNVVTLTLQAVNGVLTVSTNFTATISSNGTAEVTLSGSLTNLNALFSSTNGLLYRATTNTSGTDLLTATINDNGHSGAGTAHSVYTTLGVKFYRSYYVQWLHSKFSESELNNASLEATLWGPNADPEADGIENLAEYGLGTEPRETDSKPGAIFAEDNAQTYLSLQFNRRLDPQLILSVEVGSEVNGTWTSASADLETFAPVDLNNGFAHVRFDDRIATTEAARRFMRMRWTLQND